MSQVGQNSASKSWPNFSFRILTKRLAQNVDQSWATQSGPNLASKYWPNFSLKNLTQLQFQKLDQTSASKYQLNINFKISASISWTIISVKISTTQLPTWSSSSTSATVTTSTSFELSWHGSHKSSLYNITESVSQWVTRVDNDRTWFW